MHTTCSVESLAIREIAPTGGGGGRLSSRHLPALDGLRGIAILLVMIHHFTIIEPSGGATGLVLLRFTTCGLFGVDLFFVLSGFLITGILLDSKGSPHFLLNFYARRTLRIFPLYYVVLAGFLILPALLTGNAVRSDQIVRLNSVYVDWPWYLTYASNFLIARVGHFVHGFLDITWSLAIEEQFYVIWGLVILAVPRSWMRSICIAVIVGALLARVALVLRGAPWVQIYVLSPCRADALAMGGLCATVVRRESWSQLRKPADVWRAIRWLGLILPLFACFGWLDPVTSPFCQTVGFSLVALYCSYLLMCALRAHEGTWMQPLLSSHVLTFFGRYSYALYLLHYPVRAALHRLWFTGSGYHVVVSLAGLVNQIIFMLTATLLVIPLVLLTRVAIEAPMLCLKRYFPRSG